VLATAVRVVSRCELVGVHKKMYRRLDDADKVRLPEPKEAVRKVDCCRG
jgi:hypothetical protein